MDDVIWKQTCDDGAFECMVVGTADYWGQLIVLETATGRELLNQAVTLSYGAIFGPDVADVAAWQELALDAIDSRLPEA